MLADWYFCCCIRSNPTLTKNYLLILDLLDNQPSDSRLVPYAIVELTKTEVWMRIHALPRVLQILRAERGISSRTKRKIRNYFSPLLSRLPAGIRPFEELTDKLLHGAESPAKLLSTLALCAKNLPTDSEALISHTPYFDLEIFFPHTLILATLESLIAEHSALLWGYLEGSPEGALRGLIDKSLQGKFGRMALLLVVRLHRSAPQRSEAQLLASLWNQAETAPQFEADIIQATAEIVFSPAAFGHAPVDPLWLDILERELLTFRLWHERLGELLDNHKRRPVPEFLGLPAGGQTSRTLPLLLWFHAVCNIMVESDPQQAAEKLQHIWTPRPPNPPQCLRLKAPFRVPEEHLFDPRSPSSRGRSTPQRIDPARAWLARWQKDLQALAAVHGYTTMTIETQPGEFKFPEGHRRCLFSPWLAFTVDRHKPDPRYHGEDDPLRLLWLVGGIGIALRLHFRLDPASPCLNRFSGYLMHASGVLSRFHHGIPKETALYKVAVKKPIAALAMTGFKLTHNAGVGRYQQIEPDRFLRLFTSPDTQETINHNGEPNHTEQALINRVLPEIMLGWIMDAFQNAFVPEKGAGRWLTHFPQVVAAFKAADHQKKHETRCQLIQRFMCPPSDPAEFPNELNSWKGHYHTFLLTSELSPRNWLGGSFTEPDQWSKKKGYYPATPLVRAIERVSALGRDGDDGLDSTTVDQWRKDFLARLNMLSEPKELDRFIRLRLVQMLREPALQGWPEARQAIVRVLFEMGQGQELKAVIDAIRTMLKASASLPDETVMYAIQALERLVHESSSMIDQDVTQAPDDPLRAVGRDLKSQWLANALLDLVCTAPGESDDQAVVVNVRLAAKLKEQRSDRLKRDAMATWRLVSCSIRPGQDKSRIFLDRDEDKKQVKRGLDAASWDENQDRAHLLLNNQEDPKLSNLFLLSRQGQQVLLAENGTISVPGRIVSIARADAGRSDVLYNVGLPYPLPGSISVESKVKKGEFTKVKLIKYPGNGQWQAASSLKWEASPLPHHHGDSTILPVEIVENSTDGGKRRRFRLKYSFSGSDQSIPLPSQTWCPDLSLFYKEPGASPCPYAGYAHGKNGKVTEPMAGNFLDLLLSCFASYPPESMVQLTLVKIEGNLNKEDIPTFIFSSTPGRNFRIHGEEFFTSDLKRFQQCLAGIRRDMKIPDLAGLIVKVRLCRSSGRSRLVLAPDETAFDCRNLSWKNIFGETELAQCSQDENNWFIELGDRAVPGFPDRISVDMHGVPNDRDFTEVLITRWDYKDQCANKVIAAPIATTSFRPRDGRTVKDMVNELLAWKPGQFVKITQSLGKPSDKGTLRCLTDESVALWLETESVTLQPQFAGDRVDINGSREAVITHFNWNNFQSEPIALDDPRIPADAVKEGRCEGIVTEVPQRRGGQQGAYGTIYWVTNNRVVEGGERVRVENINDLRWLAPGAKIVGQQGSEGAWEFHVEPLYTRALAVWAIEESVVAPRNACWLFSGIAGESVAVGEIAPGRLVRLGDRFTHLCQTELFSDIKINGTETPGRLSVAVSLFQTSGSPRDCRIQYKQNEESWQMHGFCSGVTQGGGAVLDSVSYEFKPAGREGKYTVRRCFRLRPERRPRVEDQGATPRLVNWDTWLQGYLADPVPLNGRYNPKDKTFCIDEEAGVHNPPPLPVPESEGAFIAEAVYSTMTQAICCQGPQGEPLASFRKNMPCGLEEFWRELGTPVANSILPLMTVEEIAIYYVGPVECDEDRDSALEHPLHRFEWGYGKTMVIPENNLRFKGRPFTAGALLLFHGDRVTEISFSSESDNGPGEDWSPEYLNIEEFLFSRARNLYSQRIKYKLLHILRIEMREDRPSIIAVDTFDERQCKTILQSQPIYANLDDPSHTRLSSRFSPSAGGTAPERIYILGRMDTALFEKTLGRNVCYSHVRFTFEDSRLVPGLQAEERVFLACGSIKPTSGNDMRLTLSLRGVLDNTDIGADMTNLSIMRRNFSVREDLLTRIYEGKGENALLGVILIAQLSPPTGIHGYVGIDIMKRQPKRDLHSLHAFLESHTGRAFACLCTDTRKVDAPITLELHPGVFVDVPLEQIRSCGGDLDAGTVVRVDRRLDHFAITRAMFGQKRYVAEFRPTVILPKDSLLKDKAWLQPPLKCIGAHRFWYDQSQFVLGGLPNLVASLGSHCGGRWRLLQQEQGIRLMQCPFPMVGVAMLTKDPGQQKEIIRFKPAERQDEGLWRLGRLAMDKDSLQVQGIAMDVPISVKSDDRTIAPSVEDPIPWRWLTFGDQSVDEIQQRIKREKWSYHDRTTNHWPQPSENVLPEPYRLTSMDSFTGPLFFQIRTESGGLNHQAILRYSTEGMRTFGFSVETLLRVLRARAKDGGASSGRYPVAAGYADDGFWVEMSPGRLVEIPIRLCRIVIGKKSHPLTDFAWARLTPGDFVDLDLRRNPDLFAVDELSLRWLPGVRNILGQRCFLPLVGRDAAKGSVTYGAGHFMVTLPIETTAPAPALVSLTPDNQLQKISAPDELSPGDVVLLGNNENRELCILGLPGYTPVPYLRNVEEDWRTDSMHPCFIWWNEKKKRWTGTRPRTLELVRAVGGAVPVTVQWIDKKGRTLVYTRGKQKDFSTVYSGTCVMAQVLGHYQWDGTVKIILNCGGGLFETTPSSLIKGLPAEMTIPAINALIEQKTDVWIRADDNGLRFALNNPQPGNLVTDVVSVVAAEKNGEAQAGLILRDRRSQAFFWLPSHSLAWTQLTAEELTTLFNLSQADPITVILLDSEVSVIDRADLRQEFDSTAIGHEMTVIVKMPRTPDERNLRYIVQAQELGVLLECNTAKSSDYCDDHWEPGAEMAVEVVSRRYGTQRTLVVTPIGQRRFDVLLPQWFLNLSSDQRSTPRNCHVERMKWLRTGGQPNEGGKNNSMLNWRDERLEQVLCEAMQKNDESIPLTTPYMVAQEWSKRHEAAKEMDIVPAISALLIFYRCLEHPERLDLSRFGEPRKKIFSHICYPIAHRLAQNIGRRTLRSLHVEILLKHFTKTHEIRNVGLWPRICKIQYLLKPNISREELASIRRLCQVVSFSGGPDQFVIANALAASVGEALDLSSFEEHAGAMQRVLRFYRSVSPIEFSQEEDIVIKRESIELLIDVLEYIKNHDLDLTLLSPLPEI